MMGSALIDVGGQSDSFEYDDFDMYLYNGNVG